MATKITTLAHLKTVSNTVKKFISSLVGEVAETTADAIEELEGKLNKIEDKGNGKVYTLSMENGHIYLDDGKE